MAQFKRNYAPAFKLWVLYRDGGTSTLRSFDWNNKAYVPATGLRKLLEYVNCKRDQIERAVLYDHRGTTQKRVRVYYGGRWPGTYEHLTIIKLKPP